MIAAILAAALPAPSVQATQHMPPINCIGAPFSMCLEQIRSVLHTTSDAEIAKDFADLDKLDVNGKRVLGSYRSINITVSPMDLERAPPSARDIMGFDLTDDNKIKSVNVLLSSGDPAQARAESEYDGTGLYTFAHLILGSSICMDKLALYRWFENTIKPSIVHEKTERQVDEISATSSQSDHSATVPLCNNHFEYRRLFQTNTEDIDLETNPHGVSGGAFIEFSK